MASIGKWHGQHPTGTMIDPLEDIRSKRPTLRAMMGQDSV